MSYAFYFLSYKHAIDTYSSHTIYFRYKDAILISYRGINTRRININYNYKCTKKANTSIYKLTVISKAVTLTEGTYVIYIEKGTFFEVLKTSIACNNVTIIKCALIITNLSFKFFIV